MTTILQPFTIAAWFVASVSSPRDRSELRRARLERAERKANPTQPPTEARSDEGGLSNSTPPFAAIVDEHGPAVYRLAKSVVRDSSLADDVAQETFIQVWKHLGEFRGDGSLRGWVLRIAHNQAVSTLRRIKDTATDPTRLPESFDPIPVNRVVEGRVAATELMAALDELDELSRAIVVLREVEGLSYDDISETLSVPIPTVKTRLLRSRRALANQLSDWQASS